MSDSHRSDSLSPSSDAALAGLSTEQRQRLIEILDRYLAALERSQPLPREALVAENPDLAEALAANFTSLDALHDLAAGFHHSPAEAEPAAGVASGGRIGDFELIREIGRGGMGVVHEARQLSLDRRVALKLLPLGSAVDARQIARFKHEAQAAAQVQHPNVVPVFAVGEERGIHYYAMQLIAGQPLDRALAEARERRRSARRAGGQAVPGEAATPRTLAERACFLDRDYFLFVAQLGVQAAEALHAAHEFGVLHRDIKPSNLILDESGKLWVTDFGLARIARAAALSRTGDLVGTMRYMSPEQAAGKPALVDQRADVYSLGATLYELLTLQPAFAGDNGPEFLRRLERHEPPPLRSLRRDIPLDLATVVHKALARERDDRYATAQDLADDLRRMLAGQPTLARPLSLAERARRWGRRRWPVLAGAAAALALVALAVSAGGAIVVREQARATASAHRAERHFHEAREVLDRFGIKLSARLAEVAGAEGLRQELLQETAQYYRRFIETAEGDRDAQAALAEACSRLALVLDDAGSANEAAEAHARAVAAWEQVVAAAPANRPFARQLAVCRNNCGLALARAGRLDEAARQFTEAIRLQRRVASEQPQDAAAHAELGSTLGNYGWHLKEQGRQAEAEAAIREAFAILAQAAERDPQNPEPRHKLAGAVNNLAALKLDARPREAAALYEEALEHLAAAVRLAPGEDRHERDLALALSNLGAARGRCREYASAIDCYQQAIALQESLSARSPAQLTYQRDLAVSYNNLGLAQSRGQQAAEAERSFRRSLELHAALANHFPGDAHALASLASVHHNLGVALEKTGQPDVARFQFAAAAQAQQAACDADPGEASWQQPLARYRARVKRTETGDPTSSETAVAQSEPAAGKELP